MNLADYEFSRFGIKVPTGTTIKDVLKPVYFRNYADQLSPGAEIILLSDDFAMDVSLRVTSVTRTTVQSRIIRDSSVSAKVAPKPEPMPDLPKGIVVGYGGPKHMHRFLHDGEVVEHGFGSKSDAAAAALAYVDKNKVA